MWRIGSFNCLNFGMGATKDISIFVQIIKESHFDIIALQEIKGQAALDRILTGLNKNNWAGIAESESNDYAFIWNKRKFQLANVETRDGIREYAPRIYKQYKVDKKHGQMNLKRNPFYARFVPAGGGVPFIELRLINTHIRFSKGKDESTESEKEMRRHELEILSEAIYAKEADKRYGNNRPAYTILLGDYNLNLPSSEATDAIIKKTVTEIDNKKITTFQDKLSTLKNEVKEGETIFANNYDHFTYDVNRFGGVAISCKRIDTVKKYFDGDYQKHKSSVSDHIPIVMNMELNGRIEFQDNQEYLAWLEYELKNNIQKLIV